MLCMQGRESQIARKIMGKWLSLVEKPSIDHYQQQSIQSVQSGSAMAAMPAADRGQAAWAQLARLHLEYANLGHVFRCSPLRPPPSPVTPRDALFDDVPRCAQGHLLLMWDDQRTGTCSRCAAEPVDDASFMEGAA